MGIPPLLPGTLTNSLVADHCQALLKAFFPVSKMVIPTVTAPFMLKVIDMSRPLTATSEHFIYLLYTSEDEIRFLRLFNAKEAKFIKLIDCITSNRNYCTYLANNLFNLGNFVWLGKCMNLWFVFWNYPSFVNPVHVQFQPRKGRTLTTKCWVESEVGSQGGYNF